MRRLILAGVLLLSLSACDSWLGEEDGPPLPGDRISVLALEKKIKIDPRLAESEILLPPPMETPDWPQAGGYANHAMHHILIGDNISEQWSRDIGAGSDEEQRILAQPIIAQGKIFALDAENELTAYSLENGKELWQVDLTPEDEESGHISGGMAYENGRLYVGTGFAKVFAFDAESGKKIWEADVDSPIRAAPTARGNRVFVLGIDNHLYALNGFNGKHLWDFNGISETAGILGGASPAVDSGIVVAAFSSGELVAFKTDSGRQLWLESLTAVRRNDAVAALSSIRGRPVIDRGRVFASSHSGVMAALDLRTGRRIWERDLASIESPWVAGDYIYILSTDNELICLNRDTGGIHWITSLPVYDDPEERTGRIVWSGPILISDRLIIASNKEEALSVSPYSGKILGKVEMPAGVSVPPLAAAGGLYFVTDRADLVAFH